MLAHHTHMNQIKNRSICLNNLFFSFVFLCAKNEQKNPLEQCKNKIQLNAQLLLENVTLVFYIRFLSNDEHFFKNTILIERFSFIFCCCCMQVITLSTEAMRIIFYPIFRLINRLLFKYSKVTVK